jgi:hypothetical protein
VAAYPTVAEPLALADGAQSLLLLVTHSAEAARHYRLAGTHVSEPPRSTVGRMTGYHQ